MKRLWKSVKAFFTNKWVVRLLVIPVVSAAVVVPLWVCGLLAAPTASGIGLFMVATMESFNIFSAMMSSPWTVRNFGADEEKAAASRLYVWLSVFSNEVLGIGASLLSLNAWPFLGTSVASVYMWLIYRSALKKGMEEGSTGWKNAPVTNGQLEETLKAVGLERVAA